MYYLVYTSTVLATPTEEELRGLYLQCREKNTQLGISGMLLYIEGHYIQVLEGERKTVLEMYSVIQKDPRHHKVITLIQGILTRRNFPDWNMGFKALQPKGELGYINLLQDNLVFAEESLPDHPAVLLLQRFYNRIKQQWYIN